jgi:hypothetical protein
MLDSGANISSDLAHSSRITYAAFAPRGSAQSVNGRREQQHGADQQRRAAGLRDRSQREVDGESVAGWCEVTSRSNSRSNSPDVSVTGVPRSTTRSSKYVIAAVKDVNTCCSVSVPFSSTSNSNVSKRTPVDCPS